jgi:hypothetical protein
VISGNVIDNAFGYFAGTSIHPLDMFATTGGAQSGIEIRMNDVESIGQLACVGNVISLASTLTPDAFYGIGAFNGRSMTINSNVINAATVAGNFGIQVGLNAGSTATDVTVSGNIIDNFYYGIGAFYATNLNIFGNQLKTGTNPVYLSNCTTVAISNNPFTGFSGSTYTNTCTGVTSDISTPWNPTPTNLATVGTPAYNGKYRDIGNLRFWSLRITATTSTASTANSTTFPLPGTAISYGTCSAVNSNNPSLAPSNNGWTTTTLIYPPTWAAAPDVTLSGFFPLN